MRRKRTDSTTLTSVGYDRAARLLEIEFRDGSVYQYFDVPEEVFHRMLEAESKGSYFNRHVRDDYRYQKASEDLE